MLTNIKRILKSGFDIFGRNGLVSLATVTILTITLFFASFLYLSSLVSNSVVRSLKDKIDISIYFSLTTPKAEIGKLKTELENLDEVSSVKYKSRDERLASFRQSHLDNTVISGSLEELAENPLEATLNVRAKEANLYSSVVDFIDNSKYQAYISNINYADNKLAIERLDGVLNIVVKIGLVAGGVFIFLSILVAYNAIRLAIYNYRKEISVMRLVGATNSHIRGPFIVQGFLFGFLGGFVALALLLGLVLFFSPKLDNLFPENLILYFNLGIWQFYFDQC